MTIPIALLRSIRDAGFDEYWLQDRICEQAAHLAEIVGASDLRLVSKERTQSSGGRLDLLFHDDESDTMYEVEVMLGETDETHIVRTVEYWDLEKRRWPRKNHVAVLVAERINTRFYNVINLLSNAVPVIGVQANIITVGGVDALHFTKIIDSYEEPELTLPDSAGFTAETWRRDNPDQHDVAVLLERWLGETWAVEVGYHERYVAFGVAGRHRLWISWRSKGRVLFEILLPAEQIKAAEELAASVSSDYKRRDRTLKWNTHGGEIRAHEATYRRLLALIAPPPVR